MQKHIFSMRKHKLTFSPVPASSMQKARICPIEGFLAAFGGPGGVGAHRQGQKGTGHHMVSCPLLTPLTFLCAATPFGRAAKCEGPTVTSGAPRVHP